MWYPKFAWFGAEWRNYWSIYSLRGQLGTDSKCLAQLDIQRSEIMVKVKLSMFTTWRRIGAGKVKLCSFLTLPIDVGDRPALCPGRITPKKDRGYSSIWGWMSYRVRLVTHRGEAPGFHSLGDFRRSTATGCAAEKRIICCLCQKSNHDSSVAQHIVQLLYWLSCPGFVRLKKDGEEY
jgi:hypothetical protein